jgi:Na+-translocating ferredoxin:NAD+ oxidoreductase RnfG subunit
MKKNDTLKSIIVLVSICLVIAAAMAGVNMLTKDKIAAVQAEKEAKAL